MYIPYDRNLGTSPTNQVDLQIVTSVGDIHNENFFKPNVENDMRANCIIWQVSTICTYCFFFKDFYFHVFIFFKEFRITINLFANLGENILILAHSDY